MKRDPQSFKRAKFRILKNPQRVRAKFRGSDSISSLRIHNGTKNDLTWNFKVEIMLVKILRSKF